MKFSAPFSDTGTGYAKDAETGGNILLSPSISLPLLSLAEKGGEGAGVGRGCWIERDGLDNLCFVI